MYGNKITIDYPVKVAGAVIWGQVTTASSQIVLYDTNGTDILASTSWQPNLPNSASGYKVSLLFNRSVNLYPGTYYLAVSGGSSGSTAMYYTSFPSLYWKQASPMGRTKVTTVSCNTTPTSQASWTELSTSQTFIGLLVEGINNGIVETSSVFAA